LAKHVRGSTSESELLMAAIGQRLIPSYRELLARTDAPAGSCWGVFGEGDELGAVNFLTPDRVRAAAAAVRRGAVFSLDYPADAFPGPVRFRPPPVHVVNAIGNRPDGTYGHIDPSDASLVLDDYLDGFYLQCASHIDSLRHIVHPEHGFYGGVQRERMVAGDPTIGVNRWADSGIVGRGVLVDVAGYRERQGRPLDHAAAESVGPALLDATLSDQRTELQLGDMVLIRTDYPRYHAAHLDDDQAARHTAGLPQTHETVAWLWDHQVPLVAADNIAVENTLSSEPSELGEGRAGRLHAALIPLLGMVVGELWRLDELAADCRQDGVYEFMLVVKPLNVIGAVGSPANATAIK
jgi:kynurenine formamidase